MAAENEKPGGAGTQPGGGGLVATDPHDQRDFSTDAHDLQARAAAAIRGLLKGAPPNGTDPATLGPWSETWSTLAAAPDLAGRQRVFDALARDDPALAQLVAGDPPPQAKPPRKKIRSKDLVDFLTDQGYSFRLNQCDDSVEVNGERLSDVTRAKMRCQLRDAGLGKFLAAADDAMIADAAHHAYHPVRAYLEGLTWDGLGHIAQLASHATDTNGVFGLYLRRWLIGAIARAYTGSQNAVLVLDGPQGLGKSQFVRWLCSLPKLFVDSNVNPDDKDCSLLAIRSWIWEVSELGATTKRADVEALKGFLSREVFTLRPAYAHFEIVKPGLASFVGTVNNSSGIFSDPTGSRRYWATTLTALDWGYTRNVNLDQVWAEAYAAYRAGETWTLSPEEAQTAHAINDDFAFPDPVEDLLRKYFILDPAREDQWTSSADILTTLQNNGLGPGARANSMALSATLKRLGHEKRLVETIRGYVGVWELRRGINQPMPENQP